MTRKKKLFIFVPLGVLALLGAAYAVLYFSLRHPLPAGEEGPAADALARELMKTLGGDAWARTQAVRWTFRTRHQHLWDRRRGLARVRWREGEVLLDLGKRSGRAWRNHTELTGKERDDAVARAYSFWANDSFWLAAPFKLFDPGTRRYAVKLDDGRRALLVRYDEGGVTPGDSYLWILGADGRPTAWRMWVSILPVPGLETKIEKYETLATGAHIAARHKLVLLELHLTEMAGAETLAQLEPGIDPFAPLLEQRAK